MTTGRVVVVAMDMVVDEALPGSVVVGAPTAVVVVTGDVVAVVVGLPATVAVVVGGRIVVAAVGGRPHHNRTGRSGHIGNADGRPPARSRGDRRCRRLRRAGIPITAREPAVTIRADRAGLRHLMVNLVSNAARHDGDEIAIVSVMREGTVSSSRPASRP